jgi:hypothetical protein
MLYSAPFRIRHIISLNRDYITMRYSVTISRKSTHRYPDLFVALLVVERRRERESGSVPVAVQTIFGHSLGLPDSSVSLCV